MWGGRGDPVDLLGVRQGRVDALTLSSVLVQGRAPGKGTCWKQSSGHSGQTWEATELLPGAGSQVEDGLHRG